MTQTSLEKLEAALAKALPELSNAKKNSANPHFKSKYADLGAVIEAIRPVAQHGIWFRQATLPDENGITVETFYIGHGASISAGVLHMPADKRNPQGFGSALTYARRYALQTAFGLATEDDDGNAASQAPSVIGDADCVLIMQLIEATNTDARKFCQAFKISSVKDLPVDAFPKAKVMLEKKLADAAKTEDTLADDAAFLGGAA